MCYTVIPLNLDVSALQVNMYEITYVPIRPPLQKLKLFKAILSRRTISNSGL